MSNCSSSTSFLKPTTPKKYHSDSISSATDAVHAPRTRVEDESAIEKQYTFGEVLGNGAFGVVKEVTNKLTQQKFAMKIVNKDKPGSSSIQLLEREVEVLNRVNHPHIIQLEEVFETAKKVYLIMELCNGGELSDELRRRTYFKEEEAKIIMRRLTEAVVYMHDNDMVHRDLKLENILLSSADSSDNFNIKVTDFGLAHMKGLPGCDDLMHTRCGTLYYMAPEVITGHEYTKMCDVWSLGVIMYILMCGRVPFKSETATKLEELITQGQLTFSEVEWVNVSQVAKDLIRSMLCVDTSERYTARKVLDDPWFTGEKQRKGVNALDLMRTLDSESMANWKQLTTQESSIPEGEPAALTSNEDPKNSSPAKQTSDSGKRRTKSMSTVIGGSSKGGPKNTSTSSIHGRWSSSQNGNFRRGTGGPSLKPPGVHLTSPSRRSPSGNRPPHSSTSKTHH